MKKHLAIGLALAAALIASSRAGAVDVSAGVQINAPGISAGVQINSPSDFYQPLSPYGSWVNFSTYGRCWHPTQVAVDWRPYCNGSWESTDAGLYWDSDEPWAWACYHYGSWYYDTGYGWVWIPGTDWAPAWVDWRYGDNYIGWAPCGPRVTVLGPSFFVFCNAGNFTGHFTTGNLIINNTTIINQTRVYSSFSRQTVNIDGRQHTVFANRGPGMETFERASGHRFTPRPVGEVVRQTRDNARRPAGRNQPEQQRLNNNQPNREAVPPAGRELPRQSEQPNRQTPPPTGREQPRQFEQPRQPEQPQRPNEQPNRVTPPPTGREQPRQFEQPRQQREQPTPQQPEQRQLQRPEQQHREVTPPPTGRGEERNYNQSPGQERRQETPAPEQRATPAQRAVPPERSTPAERSAPSEGAKPAERALPPTGRENGQPSGRETAPPAQRPETRPAPAPEQHGPAQAPPGQERKDNRDGQGQ